MDSNAASWLTLKLEQELYARSHVLHDSFHDAEKEVFMKTLAFYTVLQDRGCPYEFERDSSLEDPSGMSSLESSDDEDILNGIRIRDIRAPKCEKTCDGKLSLHWNSAGKPFIKCEYYRLKHRQHLFIRRLDEYDTDYLTVLRADPNEGFRSMTEVTNEVTLKNEGLELKDLASMSQVALPRNVRVLNLEQIRTNNIRADSNTEVPNEVFERSPNKVLNEGRTSE
ncbi:hypothetical protein M422DRAFT_272232 [Sphaerobolus stellatus SS14]|uniref:Uncharacterized protein n=1 Tax=Sphaerobolus stellatus (strain SS14) TaxID=990650 RepID=A0A0C9UMY5_SPHS4|nr:hypothetical protein M422DRAFT_272232 [Sphaerobolus stellatus SS14]